MAGDDEAGPPPPIELDLIAAVRAAVALIHPAATARLPDLAEELSGSVAVQADPDQLAQALANLLQGALRYQPVGCRVSPAVRCARGRRPG